jgi:hypothetical protein
MSDTQKEDGIDRKPFYSEEEFKKFGLSILFDMFNLNLFKSHLIENTVFITEGLRSFVSITYNAEEEFIKFSAAHLVKSNADAFDVLNFTNFLNEAYLESFYVEYLDGHPFRIHSNCSMHIIETISLKQIFATAAFFASSIESMREVGIDNGFLSENKQGNILSFQNIKK